jgi:hypothetical protein
MHIVQIFTAWLYLKKIACIGGTSVEFCTGIGYLYYFTQAFFIVLLNVFDKLSL